MESVSLRKPTPSACVRLNSPAMGPAFWVRHWPGSQDIWVQFLVLSRPPWVSHSVSLMPPFPRAAECGGPRLCHAGSHTAVGDSTTDGLAAPGFMMSPAEQQGRAPLEMPSQETLPLPAFQAAAVGASIWPALGLISPFHIPWVGAKGQAPGAAKLGPSLAPSRGSVGDGEPNGHLPPQARQPPGGRGPVGRLLI